MRSSALAFLVIGALLAGFGAMLARQPDLPARLAGGLVPELADTRARLVISTDSHPLRRHGDVCCSPSGSRCCPRDCVRWPAC